MVSNTMRICGIDVEIEETPPSLWAMDGMGRCDGLEAKILLRDTMKPDLKQSVLLHEVLHFISDANGLDLNEQTVSVLASSLFAFLRDNKFVTGD